MGWGCKIESKYLSKNLHIFQIERGKRESRHLMGNLLKATADAGRAIQDAIGSGISMVAVIDQGSHYQNLFVSLFTWP